MLEDIKKITVLGTGVMGHGIALVCALAGYEVCMYGRTEASLERGFSQIRAGLELLARANRLDKSRVGPIVKAIKGETSLTAAVVNCNFVIEAIAEELAVKQDIFKSLDRLAPAEAILASSTSGLSPSLLAQATTNPARVLVTHFWNPPHLLPLVEVVPGKDTAATVVATARELMLKLGKKPVIVQDIPGFIGNRLQLALLREALYIVEQGWASAEDVDLAVKCSFGRRLAVTGPLESADLGGLDIFYNIQSYLNKELCQSREPSALIEAKVKQGEIGAKTGRGFYNWPEDKLQAVKSARETELLRFERLPRS
jgi:3-hydroxybutyryl-CoA dehydrogenase